jgi:uncharacterized protein (DUF2252 family)
MDVEGDMPQQQGSAAGAGQPSAAERASAGKAARKRVPRSAHAEWEPARERADPVGLLTAREAGRLPWLLPVRHARMAESPFAFYRGAAALMASDLAGTPTTGVEVQLCGDAHLANFGTFASPERRQVFDISDFDETLRGPWEWDVKRLAASCALAARDNGFDDTTARSVSAESASSYRRAMAAFAAMPFLEVWYAQLSLDLLRQIAPTKKNRRGIATYAEKTSQRALTRLTEEVDGRRQIRTDPPLLVPLREIEQIDIVDRNELAQRIEHNHREYVASLPPHRRYLLSQFRLVDLALKVVGVGSVGTRCLVVLLAGVTHGEPLVLQVKEATRSVLEPHLPAGPYRHHGERVVQGQRLIQAAGDVFLGWSKTESGPHFYWRRLHGMKGSADIASLSPRQLGFYAELCGWTLAHAHARSGDSVAIASYLGAGAAFDNAMGEFAMAYAEQTRRDHAALVAAIKSGRLAAEPG